METTAYKKHNESVEVENAIRILNKKLKDFDCNSDVCTIYITAEIEALEENISNLKQKLSAA